MDKQELKPFLKALLDPLDKTTLECDGFTRVASVWLKNAGITHDILIGRIRIQHEDKSFYPHFWIETGIYRIDYRARLWLGDDTRIAHGVFLPSESGVFYSGKVVELEPLSEAVITFLLEVNGHETNNKTTGSN